MPPDYYAKAGAIAERLETLGYSKDAERLRDAVAFGSTGTEILMALRFELDRIAAAELPLGDLASAVKSLMRELDTVMDS